MSAEILRGYKLSISDFETYSTMVEGLELVSHIIVQIAEVEKSLSGQGGFKRELSRTIIELYVKVLGFLAAAQRFFDQNTGGESPGSNNQCTHVY